MKDEHPIATEFTLTYAKLKNNIEDASKAFYNLSKDLHAAGQTKEFSRLKKAIEKAGISLTRKVF